MASLTCETTFTSNKGPKFKNMLRSTNKGSKTASLSGMNESPSSESSSKTCFPSSTGRYFRMKDSRVFTIQALIVWAALCLPGNIVTLFMYNRIQERTAGLAAFPTPGWDAESKDLGDKATALCAIPDFHSLFLDKVGEVFSCQVVIEGFLKEKEMACIEEKGHGESEECFIQYIKNLPSILTTLKQILQSKVNYTCHELFDEYETFRNRIKFWLEGVGILAIGIFGLCGNILTCIILREKDTNINFNKLLIALAVADNCMILDMITEKAIIGCFLPKEPYWYRLSYPYFFYPFKGIIQAATIFLVVAVSAERYRAVCHPMTQRQAAYKFVLTVVFISVTLKIPRFFHFKLVDNNTDYWTTDLMEDPSYIRFSSYWDDLISTGFIPLMTLVYFNLRIYLKIRASAKLECRYIGGHSRSANYSENPTLTTSLHNDGNDIEIQHSRSYGPERSFRRNNSFRGESTGQPDGGQPVVIKGRYLARLHPAASNGRNSSRSYHQAFRGNNSRIKNNSYREKDHFRKRREKSTMILVAIVIIFMVCHSYRLSLKVYEVANPDTHTMDRFKYCHQLGRHHVPVASYILHNTHHVFLVLNSSLNFIIYCCVGKEFRNKMMALFTNMNVCA